MNSNERRLKILYLLQSGKKLTSNTLMEEFCVSKRTVYRDLKVIQELGVPVTHYPDTGYGILRDGLIPPIMFNFRELAVIMMGLSFVKSQINDEMVNDAENVALKIRSSVPTNLQKQMNILEQRTLVSPYIHNIEKREEGGDWFVLCSAFVDKKTATFLYQDRKGNHSVRTIDPYALIHFTDHWNVIGYCHDRRALRNFVLSRISDIRLGESFVVSEREYNKEELLYERAEQEIEIIIDVNKHKAFSFLSELPGKILSKKEFSTRLRVTFVIDNLDYINEWLLRFGKHITILAPDSLIKKRQSLLNVLLNKSL
ncbi:MAG: YafY family protein [Balneolales bacterium]